MNSFLEALPPGFKLVSFNCVATAAGGCEFGLFVMVTVG